MTIEEAIKILKAIRVYECYPKSASEETKEALDMAIEALSERQGEIVRCKDCRYYEQKQKNMPYNVSKRYCNRSCVLATKENDFCSYGERREP